MTFANVRQHPYVNDATRISDGALVLLKQVSVIVHPHEVSIGRYLCSDELRSDPDNHCVPLHDVLKDPSEENTVILVMPLLRKCDDPEFDTIGEVVDFIRQLVNVRMGQTPASLHLSIMCLSRG